eukprot:gene326-209_t
MASSSVIIVPKEIGRRADGLINSGVSSSVIKGVELLLQENIYIDGGSALPAINQLDCSVLFRKGTNALQNVPFDLLGVEVNCQTVDVRKAYKKLALKYHPDKNPKTTPLFQLIQAASTKLTDSDQRAKEAATVAQKRGAAGMRAEHRASAASFQSAFQKHQTAQPSSSTTSSSSSSAQPNKAAADMKGRNYYEELLKEQYRKAAAAEERAREYANRRFAEQQQKFGAAAYNNGSAANNPFDQRAGQQQSQPNLNPFRQPANQPSNAVPTAANGNPVSVPPAYEWSNMNKAAAAAAAAQPGKAAASAAASTAQSNPTGGGAAGTARTYRAGADGKVHVQQSFPTAGGATTAATANANGVASQQQRKMHVPKPYDFKFSSVSSTVVELEWKTTQMHHCNLAVEFSWKEKFPSFTPWETAEKLIRAGCCRKKNLKAKACYEFRVRAVEEMAGGQVGNRSDWTDVLTIVMPTVEQANPNAFPKMPAAGTNVEATPTPDASSSANTKPTTTAASSANVPTTNQQQGAASATANTAAKKPTATASDAKNKPPVAAAAAASTASTASNNGAPTRPRTPTQEKPSDEKVFKRFKSKSTLSKDDSGIFSPAQFQFETETNLKQRSLDDSGPLQRKGTMQSKASAAAASDAAHSSPIEKTLNKYFSKDKPSPPTQARPNPPRPDAYSDDEFDEEEVSEEDAEQDDDEEEEEEVIRVDLDKAAMRGGASGTGRKKLRPKRTKQSSMGSRHRGGSGSMGGGGSSGPTPVKKLDAHGNPFDFFELDASFDTLDTDEIQYYQLHPPSIGNGMSNNALTKKSLSPLGKDGNSNNNNTGQVQVNYRHPVHAEPYPKSAIKGYIKPDRTIIGCALVGEWVRVKIHMAIYDTSNNNDAGKKQPSKAIWGWCLRSDGSHDFLRPMQGTRSSLSSVQSNSSVSGGGVGGFSTPMTKSSAANAANAPTSSAKKMMSPPKESLQRGMTKANLGASAILNQSFFNLPKQTPTKEKMKKKPSMAAGGGSKPQYPSIDETEEGHVYYYNEKTMVSKWELPEWVEEEDPTSGAKYYVHAVGYGDNITMLSTWTKPKKFARLIRSQHYT